MSIERSSGILFPITSLPGNYGIGTLGKEAYRFVDFLQKAKQHYWQILPIGPTGYGDSPYSSFSSFAGNPYMIDLDELIKEKLLKKEEVAHLENSETVDYGYLYSTRFSVLYKAYRRGIVLQKEAYNRFVNENRNWLEKYALFMACKKHFEMVSWQKWPDEKLRLYDAETVEKYRNELKDDVEFYQFIQYLFFRQYFALKDYANTKGIRLIGDLPIYIALDSAEAWSDYDQFQLNEYHMPTSVAGVPPDYFSKDGQLWGNPLYEWEKMKKDGYKWWIERVGQTAKYYDVIRIDHFRGFEDYWAVAQGETTARNGRWIKGPSFDFVSVLKNWFSQVEFIAEDLGEITEDVMKLVKDSTFPGMRVLQFTGGDPSSCHCPHNYSANTICYLGTHDNLPTAAAWKKMKPKEKKAVSELFGLNEKEGIVKGFIRVGMGSVSKLFIGTIQDYLEMGEEAAINRPGTLGNWTWRIDGKLLSSELAKTIAQFTVRYNRD